MRIDDYLQVYQFREYHETNVRATPERVMRAIKEVTPREIAVLRALLAIRGAPARILGHGAGALDAGRPFLDQFLRSGAVLLAEDERELVIGLVGRFWQLVNEDSPPIADARAFLDFNAPGYAKVAVNLRLVELRGDELTHLSTETRIFTTDDESHRRFAPYWRVVSPGSALIRRMWLRAIKRRAERTAGGGSV